MLELGGEPVLGAPGAAQQPTLTFQNGFASWTIGCNGFDALYRSRDDRLAFRPRHARRIGGCQAWEQPIQAALWAEPKGEGMAFRREDRDLVIETPQGPLELRRVPFQPVRAR